MLKLKDPSLFKQQCYLNGEWVSGSETTEVTNPATGEVIGHVPKLGQAEAAKAIADANAASLRQAEKAGARPLHLAAAFALPPEALGAVGGAAGSALAGGEAQLCAIAWAARHRSAQHGAWHSGIG
mgnify:CR=1 FL=1